jgi:hypothetical protein
MAEETTAATPLETATTDIKPQHGNRNSRNRSKNQKNKGGVNANANVEETEPKADTAAPQQVSDTTSANGESNNNVPNNNDPNNKNNRQRNPNPNRNQHSNGGQGAKNEASASDDANKGDKPAGRETTTPESGGAGTAQNINQNGPKRRRNRNRKKKGGAPPATAGDNDNEAKAENGAEQAGEPEIVDEPINNNTETTIGAGDSAGAGAGVGAGVGDGNQKGGTIRNANANKRNNRRNNKKQQGGPAAAAATSSDDANANKIANVPLLAKDEKLSPNVASDPRGDDPSQRMKHNTKHNKKQKAKGGRRNTESFDPASTLVRPALRIHVGSATLPKYSKPLKHDDAVIVPELFGAEDDWSMYYKLVEEMTELQQQQVKGSEWISWHQGSHLIAEDPKGSKTFTEIVDKLCDYFEIKGSIGTRLNWYKDSLDWKPFHHDSA